jgi:hypothetical protein
MTFFLFFLFSILFCGGSYSAGLFAYFDIFFIRKGGGLHKARVSIICILYIFDIFQSMFHISHIMEFLTHMHILHVVFDIFQLKFHISHVRQIMHRLHIYFSQLLSAQIVFFFFEDAEEMLEVSPATANDNQLSDSPVQQPRGHRRPELHIWHIFCILYIYNIIFYIFCIFCILCIL